MKPDGARYFSEIVGSYAGWFDRRSPLVRVFTDIAKARAMRDVVGGVIMRRGARRDKVDPMPNVDSSRIISSAVSAPMTTNFLAAIRAAGVTRSTGGYIVDAAGIVRAPFINGGSWDLTTALASGGTVDAVTFADLRTSPAAYSRELTFVTFRNSTKSVLAIVAVDPGSPIDPG